MINASKMAEVSENGSSTESSESLATSSNPLLRPSAFKPSPNPGIIAPSRLTNPFAAKHVDSASNEGAVGGPALSRNPFARVHHPASNEESAGESTPSKFVLRPSALDKQTASFSNVKSTSSESAYKSSFQLEPAKIQSPFTTTTSSKSKEDGCSVAAVTGSTSEAEDNPESASVGQNNEALPATSGSKNDEISKRLFGQAAAQPDSSVSSSSSGQEQEKTSHIFGSNLSERVQGTSAVSSSTRAASASGFVFGQNLSERVVNTPHKDREKVTEEENKSDVDTTSSEPAAPESQSPKPTLEESAAQYEASKQRPELAPVDVRTGEEEESNVFQFNVKLFVFDQTKQTWIERGRGLLRLNDMTDDDSASFQSRLVMRTHGSLRVVLNTKIWAGMIIERASHKAIRVSAKDIEGDSVKIFLIMANPKDSDQIFSAIDSRVQQLKAQETEQPGGATSGEDEESRGEYPPSSPPGADSQLSDVTSSSSDKRQNETIDEASAGPMKKRRVDIDQPRDPVTEESNDSSTVDPETEASNESFTSSPTVKSSSSEA